MMLLNYQIIFFTFILFNLSNQLKLFPYWVRVNGQTSMYDYNGYLFESLLDMINKILKENKVKNPLKACLYNVGYKKGIKLNRQYSTLCESIASYTNPKTNLITYYVENPSKRHKNEYWCKDKKFKSFEAALEFALLTQKYIKFYPYTTKPVPAPKNFCIYTTKGPICYMKNPATQCYWRQIWCSCHGSCYYHSNFANTKKHYFDEINLYRKFLGMKPLHPSNELSCLAQVRAEEMAKKGNLIPDKKKKISEVIFYSQYGHGIYAMKILFDDTYFSQNSLRRRSIGFSKDFVDLMYFDQKFIGIGLSSNRYGTYACIKFSMGSW